MDEHSKSDHLYKIMYVPKTTDNERAAVLFSTFSSVIYSHNSTETVSPSTP